MDGLELLERIDRRLEAFTDVMGQQVAEIRAQRTDQRDEFEAHREELVAHREELVALRQSSDLQIEELRRQSDRSDMLTQAVVRALERLEGPGRG